MKDEDSEKEIQWKETVTRPLSPLKGSQVVRGCNTTFPSKMDFTISRHLAVPEEDRHTIFLDGEELKTASEKISNLCNDLSFVKKFVQECRNSSNEIVEVSKKFRKKDLSRPPLSELREMWMEFQEKVEIHSSYYSFAFVFIEKVLTKMLKEKLERFDDSGKLFGIFNSKTQLNENEREERNLLRIAKQVKEGGYTEEIKKKLEEHKGKYSWYPVYDYTLDPWSLEDFKDRIEKVKNKAEEELEERKDPEEVKEMAGNKLEEIDADDELRDLVHLFQDYVFLRTRRTNALRKSYYNSKPFLKEISKRIEWSKSLIPYFTNEELDRYLKEEKLPDKEEIQRRKKGHLLLKKDDELKVYSKRWKILETIREEVRKEEIQILDGKPVYSGKVRGSVKIVNSSEEGDKLMRNDILVSKMTTPDMTDLIKDAGAIVTDEGGMTSHAAVISKEMGVPCVIGTENATQKLEDGDWIEVDANDGKILKVEQELPSVYDQMSTVAGFIQPYLKFQQFASTAENEILILSVGEEVPKEVQESLENLQEKGIKIRFIATEKKIDVLKKFHRKWADEIRYYPSWTEEYNFAVVDDKKCLQAIRNPRDPEDRFYMFFQTEGLSQALKDYFENIWKKAKKIEFEGD